jgi:hypothetical protein
MKWLLVMVAAVAVACGPSNAEVKVAKTTQYATQPATLYSIAMQVAARDYKIGETDPDGGRFSTEPQFYNPEGGRQSPSAGGYVGLSSGSILLSLIVEVLESERGHIVVITPKSFQVVAGSPKPRELAPDDPNLPGWVPGRVDSLAVAIYEAAKQHAAPR